MAARRDVENEKIKSGMLAFPLQPEPVQIRVDQRLDIFNKVKELRIFGTPLKRISKVVGISRNKVKSYCMQETLIPRSHPKSSNIEKFTGYILTRLTDGNSNKKDIIDEIVQLGYTGRTTLAYTYIREIQSEYGLCPLDHNGYLQKLVLRHIWGSNSQVQNFSNQHENQAEQGILRFKMSLVGLIKVSFSCSINGRQLIP